MRSSALGAWGRLWVRDALRSGVFPLVRSLPSPTSVACSEALFGEFSGTTERSDFPCSSIIDVCLQTSRCGLGVRQGKHGTSRFPGEMRPRVLGVLDRAGFATVLRGRRS